MGLNDRADRPLAITRVRDSADPQALGLRSPLLNLGRGMPIWMRLGVGKTLDQGISLKTGFVMPPSTENFREFFEERLSPIIK